MKKRILALLIVTVCALMLSACSCEHQWANASCTKPKICTLCSETEGDPLGHSWVEATCETPKTCVLCDEVEGGTPGHSWVDATCDLPKTCTACAATEGEATGHSWADWTRVRTDAHRICKSCGTEEVITMSDYLVTQLQGYWISTKDIIGEDVPPTLFTTFEIRADGTVGLYTPSGVYPSYKLEYVLPENDLDHSFDEELQSFMLTADDAERSYLFDHVPQGDFIVGYQGFIYERESAEAAAIREMLQGKWIFDSFYAYDDTLAELDHSGYTVEFHEGNKFTVCAETQFEGTWIYYPGDQFESDGVTYYSILATVGEDWWSMYFTLEIHSDSGVMILRVDRPRMERTEFVKTE